MANLQPLQFHFQEEGPIGYPQREHWIEAYSGSRKGENADNYAGGFSWHPQTGEIGWVETRPPYQRQGVATQMLQHAQFLAKTRGLATPVHSDDQTDSGAAWAKARPI